MNCIHRRECVDAEEHKIRTQNDMWFLGASFGGLLGFAVGALVGGFYVFHAL